MNKLVNNILLILISPFWFSCSSTEKFNEQVKIINELILKNTSLENDVNISKLELSKTQDEVEKLSENLKVSEREVIRLNIIKGTPIENLSNEERMILADTYDDKSLEKSLSQINPVIKVNRTYKFCGKFAPISSYDDAAKLLNKNFISSCYNLDVDENDNYKIVNYMVLKVLDGWVKLGEFKSGLSKSKEVWVKKKNLSTPIVLKHNQDEYLMPSPVISRILLINNNILRFTPHWEDSICNIELDPFPLKDVIKIVNRPDFTPEIDDFLLSDVIELDDLSLLYQTSKSFGVSCGC